MGPALVRGVTAMVPLSVAGTIAAAAHLRRGRARRRWTAWAWSLFSASSVAATVALSMTIGVRAGLSWFPEVAPGILVSGALGGFALVARVVAVLRRGRGNRRPRPGSVR